MELSASDTLVYAIRAVSFRRENERVTQSVSDHTTGISGVESRHTHFTHRSRRSAAGETAHAREGRVTQQKPLVTHTGLRGRAWSGRGGVGERGHARSGGHTLGTRASSLGTPPLSVHSVPLCPLGSVDPLSLPRTAAVAPPSVVWWDPFVWAGVEVVPQRTRGAGVLPRARSIRRAPREGGWPPHRTIALPHRLHTHVQPRRRSALRRPGPAHTPHRLREPDPHRWREPRRGWEPTGGGARTHRARRSGCLTARCPGCCLLSTGAEAPVFRMVDEP